MATQTTTPNTTPSDNYDSLSPDELISVFSQRLSLLEHADKLRSLTTCAFLHTRNLCVDKHCESCRYFFPRTSIRNPQGKIVKALPVVANGMPQVLSVLEKGYSELDLKQGKIKRINFAGQKNISDVLPVIKSQVIKNVGYRYIHVANWMNEDTYFYMSQGEGVRCVKLAALTGKYILLKNTNDVEFLLGSDKMWYRTEKYSLDDVCGIDIRFVAEKVE